MRAYGRGGGQRERQRLAVRARTQRVVGLDELAELQRHRVVGDRPAPREQVQRRGREPTLLYAVPVLAALRARACSGSGRMNVPLTRWPVPNELGSDTLSSASPAVEITFAVVEAMYVLRDAGRERRRTAPAGRASATAWRARCRRRRRRRSSRTSRAAGPGAGGVAGRGRVQVRQRVLERRRALGPRRDALEAEAPQQRVLGRDARALGEADGAARDPRRVVLGARRAAGRPPTGRGRSRSPLDSVTAPSLRTCRASRNTPRPAIAKSCA